MSTAAQVRAPGSRAGPVFERVVVGIDGSEPSLEACRQALRLVEPGSVEAIVAVYLIGAVAARWPETRIREALEAEGGDALRAAEALAPGRVAGSLVSGAPAEVLLHEVERRDATLLALGTHGHSRLSEILIGGVAGELLHRAPCSVLIARPPRQRGAFPAAIVVGVDGSSGSERALAAAISLRDRFGASLRALVAVHGKAVDATRLRARIPGLEPFDERPVELLVDASEDADLVVIGSRGLHGLRALGSVGERVAHGARSSVLVVR